MGCVFPMSGSLGWLGCLCLVVGCYPWLSIARLWAGFGLILLELWACFLLARLPVGLYVGLVGCWWSIV